MGELINRCSSRFKLSGKKTFSGKKLEEASGRVTEKKSLTDLQDEKIIEGLITYEETDQEPLKDR